MQMLDFYRSVLEAAGLGTQTIAMQVPSEGAVTDVNITAIHIKSPDAPVMLTIDGNSVILPERDILRLGIPEGTYAFHPVCESPVRKDSPVFLRLQKCILTRMNTSLAQLLYELTTFAASTDKHISASPQQAEFLALVPHINAKTLDKVRTLLEKKLNIQGDPTSRLISIATRRNVPREDKAYARGCTTLFPWNEFRNKDNILTVKGNRAADVPSIFAVLDYILPNNNEDNFYSSYSDDLRAPSLVALLGAAGKVFAQINRVVDVFSNQLSSPELLKTDLSFLIGLDYINKYRNELGEMRGNIGEPLQGKEADNATPKPAQLRFAPPADEVRPKAPTPSVASSIVAPAPQTTPLAASIVGTLPAPKTPTPDAAPMKSWMDIQEENRQKQMALQVAQQPQPVLYQPPVVQQYQQPVPQQQMVQVVDPATGQTYLMPLAQQPMQPQYQQPVQQQYYAPQQQPQQQYYAPPQQLAPPNTNNGFPSYGPASVPQYQQQQYQPQYQPQYQQPTTPVSPGRYAAAVSRRGYR